MKIFPRKKEKNDNYAKRNCYVSEEKINFRLLQTREVARVIQALKAWRSATWAREDTGARGAKRRAWSRAWSRAWEDTGAAWTWIRAWRSAAWAREDTFSRAREDTGTAWAREDTWAAWAREDTWAACAWSRKIREI